ncbi:uncharacterized protein [Desmodus rotundus]|uniref:uncharacterized protein isoform X2 n=1 Tax=Desmodus rotundus TaxID=9430 RepID=UPI0039E60D42
MRGVGDARCSFSPTGCGLGTATDAVGLLAGRPARAHAGSPAGRRGAPASAAQPAKPSVRASQNPAPWRSHPGRLFEMQIPRPRPPDTGVRRAGLGHFLKNLPGDSDADAPRKPSENSGGHATAGLGLQLQDAGRSAREPGQAWTPRYYRMQVITVFHREVNPMADALMESERKQSKTKLISKGLNRIYVSENDYAERQGNPDTNFGRGPEEQGFDSFLLEMGKQGPSEAH